MPRRTYTETERAEATALYMQHGAAEAGRRTGIPAGTIAAWANRDNLASERQATIADRVEGRRLAWEERRTEIATRCGEVAATAMERVAAAVDGDGTLMVEKRNRKGERIVQVADPADALKLATIMAILVDKAQLLTGGATSRAEHATAATVRAKLADVSSLAAKVERSAA